MGYKVNPITGELMPVGVTEQELAAELQQQRGEIETSLSQELQAAVQRVEGTASVATTVAATLPAGSTGPVAVSMADPEFLGTETSIKGLLGTVYGVLARAADGSYSFTSEQTYTGSVALGAGTIFAAAHLPNTLNPLRVGDAELEAAVGYEDAGYAYALLDPANRLAFWVEKDGTVSVVKARAEVFQCAEVVTDKLTAPGGTIDLDSADTQLLNIIGGGLHTGAPEYAEFYLHAVVDSTNRIAYGLRHDGSFLFTKPIDADIQGESARAAKLAPLGDNEIEEVSGFEFYASVELDSADRISRAILPSGQQYIPRLKVDELQVDSFSPESLDVGQLTINGQPVSGLSSSAITDGSALYESKGLGGYYHLFKFADDTYQQLTFAGNNYNLSFTAEQTPRLLFQSTRTGIAETHVINKDGTGLSLAVPPKNLVLWGDSMTAGLGSTRVANALGDGRRVVANGYGGRRSVFIAARQGGFPVTGDIANSEIPASGAVAVSNFYPTEVLDTSYQSLSCTVNGLAGTLNYNGGSWTFTRSAAGNAVAVTNPVTFEPVLNDTVNGVVYNLNEYTGILWLGRNGVGGTQGETDVPVYEGVIAKFRNLFKRLIILPIFNGGYSHESDGDPAIPTTSTSGYNGIMGRNGNIAAAFPDLWYDVRRDFIDGSEAWLQANYPAAYALDWTRSFYQIGSGAVSGRPATANNGDIWDDSGTKTIYDTTTSSWVAYTGNPRTQANLGPGSAWDVANDVPPRAMRGDNIHLNNYGNEFLAELLAAKVQSLGW